MSIYLWFYYVFSREFQSYIIDVDNGIQYNV